MSISKASLHIWDTKAIARDFASDNMDQKTVFYYLLVALIASAILALDRWALSVPDHLVQRPIEEGMQLLFYSAGAYWCFRANGGASGKQFLERLLAFGVANILRVLVFVRVFIHAILIVGVLFLSYLHIQIFKSPEGLWLAISDQLFELPGYLFWFWLIRKNILSIGKIEAIESGSDRREALISFVLILYAAVALLMDFGCLSVTFTVQKCSNVTLMPSSLVTSLIFAFIGLTGLRNALRKSERKQGLV